MHAGSQSKHSHGSGILAMSFQSMVSGSAIPTSLRASRMLGQQVRDRRSCKALRMLTSCLQGNDLLAGRRPRCPPRFAGRLLLYAAHHRESRQATIRRTS